MSQPTDRYLTEDSIYLFRGLLIVLLVLCLVLDVVLILLLIWAWSGIKPVVYFTWGCIMDFIDLMFYWSIQWLDFLGTFAL